MYYFSSIEAFASDGNFLTRMRRSYHLGPFGWPEWLRVLVVASFFGPLLLFLALLGYGAVALISNELDLYALPVGPEFVDSSWGEVFTIVIFSSIAGPFLVAAAAAVIWEVRWQWEYRRDRRAANRSVKVFNRRAEAARLNAGRPVRWGHAFCALAVVLILAVWLPDLWREGHGAVPAPAPSTVVREAPLPASAHFSRP
ncbi:MAG: hypothetical protein JOY92_07620 [Verrucomicrobia bacterium]|nr:hypothetical protein [Verrucomicrobiota bacterium]